MNQTQRKQVATLVETLNAVHDELEQLSNDEQEKVDNLEGKFPDKVQDFSEAANALSDFRGRLEQLIGDMEEYA